MPSQSLPDTFANFVAGGISVRTRPTAPVTGSSSMSKNKMPPPRYLSSTTAYRLPAICVMPEYCPEAMSGVTVALVSTAGAEAGDAGVVAIRRAGPQAAATRDRITSKTAG